MAELAQDILEDTLYAQIDLFADTFAYKVFGAPAAVNVKAIYKPGFVDGVQNSSHALLTIMPGARTGDDDTLHLPNAADSNTGDLVTVDGVDRRVMEIKRSRGRFTRVTIEA